MQEPLNFKNFLTACQKIAGQAGIE